MLGLNAPLLMWFVNMSLTKVLAMYAMNDAFECQSAVANTTFSPNDQWDYALIGVLTENK